MLCRFSELCYGKKALKKINMSSLLTQSIISFFSYKIWSFLCFATFTESILLHAKSTKLKNMILKRKLWVMVTADYFYASIKNTFDKKSVWVNATNDTGTQSNLWGVKSFFRGPSLKINEVWKNIKWLCRCNS